MNRRTLIVVLLAVLAIGAGGGAVAAGAFESGTKTVVRQVTVAAAEPASATISRIRRAACSASHSSFVSGS